jgi:uncharacterized membrane protein
MEILTEIFSYVCGRNRCFVIEGQTLLVCQRCLGLYAGVLFTLAWLIFSRAYRRGLPSRSLTLLHIAMILTAMAGGIHLLDPGPRWRLLCGIWTGHVITLWLMGSGIQLRYLSGSRTVLQKPWRTREKIGALITAGFVTILAVIFPYLQILGGFFWSIVILLGFLALAGILFFSILSLTTYLQKHILKRKYSIVHMGPDRQENR